MGKYCKDAMALKPGEQDTVETLGAEKE